MKTEPFRMKWISAIKSSFAEHFCSHPSVDSASIIKGKMHKIIITTVLHFNCYLIKNLIERTKFEWLWLCAERRERSHSFSFVSGKSWWSSVYTIVIFEITKCFEHVEHQANAWLNPMVEIGRFFLLQRIFAGIFFSMRTFYSFCLW